MNLRTKYLSYNNGLPYYQRVVPPPLQPHLKQRVIKIPLRQELSFDEQQRGVSMELSLLGQVSHLSKLHSELFQAGLDNPDLLKNWVGTQIRPTQSKELMLSDSFDIYLSNHQRGKDIRFIAYTKYKWNTFLGIVGDMPLRLISRHHAKQYRDKRLHDGLKTTSVKREIKHLSAIIRKTFLELDLDRSNPFSGIEIPSLGVDSQKRIPFTAVELTTLVKACLEKNDSKRRILLIIALTGMRLNEVIGLRKEDVYIGIDNDIDYLKVQPNSKRRLKTKGSTRDIPLLKILLPSIAIQMTLSEDIDYLFDDYMSENITLSNNASATLNNFIKTLGINKSIHCLRHTMRDLLCEAGTTKDVIDSIGGWSCGDMSSMYGKGHSLKTKLNALSKAYKCINRLE